MHVLHFRVIRTLSAAILTLGLAACDVTMPSQVETSHMRLSEETRSIALDAAKPSDDTARRVAKDFRENGRGEQRLVVPYKGGDPLQETQARRHGKEWQAALARSGMPDVDAEYVAVSDTTLLGRAVLSYNVLTALPPEPCGQRLSGYKGGDTLEDMHTYRIGCETKTALSKMIVNPEDLKGRDGTEPGDSRRQGTVVERYMGGEGMEPLDGQTASNISN